MNENKQIAELIHRRREQMLVHSYIYYQLNDNIIDDSTWSKWAMELQKMCEKPTTLVVGVSVKYLEDTIIFSGKTDSPYLKGQIDGAKLVISRIKDYEEDKRGKINE